MTDKLQRLELTWPGKEDRFNPEPRILLEDKEKSYSAPDSLMQGIVESMGLEQKVQPTFDNMLIHGDNLLALKALEQDYAGKVKCIYIDPPYNTGNAFEHYDDGLEHSIWLSLMRDRLEILKRLLSDNGMIFVQIDDNEQAYLKVLMDEIFGRNNFINVITIKTKIGGVSGSSEGKSFKDATEFICVYTKDKTLLSINPVYIKTQLFNRIKSYEAEDRSWKYTSIVTRLDDKVLLKEDTLKGMKFYGYKTLETKSITSYALSEGLTEEEVYNKYADKIFQTTNAQSSVRQTVIQETAGYDYPMFGLEYVPIKGKNMGNTIEILYKGEQRRMMMFLSDAVQKIDGVYYYLDKVTSLWDDIQYNNLTKEGDVQFPNGKKPEALIERILALASNPGDLVLDSFLGSGTTAAVAHKMGRRWIGVEMGDHVYTHCLPRLKKVINGEDAGGVTKSTGWLCGGGFKFYELASSLIVKDKYGQQIISDKYNADMLAEAMCKILGYHYKPDSTAYWKQGYSSEKSFIYTTTFSMQEASLERLHEEVGDNNLLVCCSAFSGNSKAYPNISVKKIPAAILKKCEWGREGYPLNLTNYHPDDKEFEFDEENDE